MKGFIQTPSSKFPSYVSRARPELVEGYLMSAQGYPSTGSGRAQK